MRFERFHQVDEGAIAPSPSDFWPPTRSGNVGERERDGVRVANGNWTGALVAGAAAGVYALAPVVDCGVMCFVEIKG